MMTIEPTSSDILRSVMSRITTYRRDRDGRRLVAVALGAYFALVGLPRLLWGINIWPKLGVPAAPTLFFDTRVLTAAVECERRGLNPLRYNPCDPAHRPFNYPRVWLLLRWIGVSQASTGVLAVIFVALFLVTLFLLFGRIGLGEGTLVALAVCSPAVMLGIERGNTDIAVFSLLASAALLWKSASKRYEVSSPLIVFVAAILKLFPVFGLAAYAFALRRRAAVTAFVLLAAFSVYVLIFKEDIAAIMHGTPQGTENAYGARILPAAIYHRFVRDRLPDAEIIKQLIAVVPLVLGTPVLWILGRRRRPTPDKAANSYERIAFYTGSFIFVGTFIVGNNWDYRLVFILLTLPQLFRWITDPLGDPRASLAAYALVAILVLLWIGALSRQLALMDELATWIVVGLLLMLLAASIPFVRSTRASLRAR